MPRRAHDFKANGHSRNFNQGRQSQASKHEKNVAALSKQVGELRIKLSQLDSAADFNSFNIMPDDSYEDDSYYETAYNNYYPEVRPPCNEAYFKVNIVNTN